VAAAREVMCDNYLPASLDLAAEWLDSSAFAAAVVDVIDTWTAKGPLS
jgi:hypothetical protein